MTADITIRSAGFTLLLFGVKGLAAELPVRASRTSRDRRGVTRGGQDLAASMRAEANLAGEEPQVPGSVDAEDS